MNCLTFIQNIFFNRDIESIETPIFQTSTGKTVEEIFILARAFLHGISSSFSVLFPINILVNSPSLSAFITVGLLSGTICLGTEILIRAQTNPSASMALKKITLGFRIANASINHLAHFGASWNACLFLLKQLIPYYFTSERNVQIISYLMVPPGLVGGFSIAFSRYKTEALGYEEANHSNEGLFITEMIRGFVAPTFLMIFFEKLGLLPSGKKITLSSLSTCFAVTISLAIASRISIYENSMTAHCITTLILELIENTSASAVLTLLPNETWAKTHHDNYSPPLINISVVISILYLLIYLVSKFTIKNGNCPANSPSDELTHNNTIPDDHREVAP